MINSLNVSLTGLRAAQTAVENVSNNIANENTAGYKKRVVQFSEIEHLDARNSGRGVSSDEIYRITNEYAYNNLITEGTKSSYYEQRSELLGNAEAIFRETDTAGFSSDLDRYFQAIENYRANPNSEIYKTDLTNQAVILVDSMNSLYTDIEKQQSLMRDSLDADVEKINTILHDIGELNERLGDHQAVGNDLLDRRDQLEDELSKYVDIEVDRTPGEYTLEVAGVVAIRYNTNVRDMSIDDLKEPQSDKFVKFDSVTGNQSNILDGVTFDNEDKITFKLDNLNEVSVQYGETVVYQIDPAEQTELQDQFGANITFTVDPMSGNTFANVNVDETNYVRMLAHKINSDPEMQDKVQAFNGNYKVEQDPVTGDDIKVENNNFDQFLVIEAINPGLEGQFESRISIVEQTDASDPDTITNRVGVYKDEDQSSEAVERAVVSIYDSEVTLKSGSVKAKVENLDTENPNNKLQTYKEALDDIARTLGDITDTYVITGDNEYVYGEKAADEYNGTGKIVDLGLFTGSSVKTLQFHKDKVDGLSQDDLDYLSTMQWKTDLSFGQQAQDASSADTSTFREYLQELKFNVSTDKENNDFLGETQRDVVFSLQSNYDQVVKVDKDEEMMNLVKFQSAYTANAKVVTVVDEMLQTLLGLKR